MTTSVTDRFIFGQKDIAAAGTAELLEAAEYQLQSLMIIAKAANTGKVFYGGVDVNGSTQAGLAAGESITLGPEPALYDKPFLLSSIFIDVGVNGEGVDFIGARM